MEQHNDSPKNRSGSKHRANIPASEDIFGTGSSVFDRLTGRDQPKAPERPKPDLPPVEPPPLQQSQSPAPVAPPPTKESPGAKTITEPVVTSPRAETSGKKEPLKKSSLYLTAAESAKLENLARELRRATGDNLNTNDVVRRLIERATAQSLLD